MNEGYIKLSRKFFSNIMWTESRTFSRCEAWLDLIQLARYEDEPQKDCVGKRKVVYGRGQYPASINILSKRWQWSDKKVRCFLEYLKKQEMISVECFQGVNILTLCKYDEYNPRGTIRGTIKGAIRGTDNELDISDLDTPRGTIKGAIKGAIRGTNTNKENNIKEIPPKGGTKKDAALAATLSRKEDFYQSLVPFVGKYPKEMIREFFDYWSEMNKSCTKMRFEQQPTWEVAKRLATWASKDNQYYRNNGTNRQTYSTAEQRANDAAEIVARLRAEDDAAGK